MSSLWTPGGEHPIDRPAAGKIGDGFDADIDDDFDDDFEDGLDDLGDLDDELAGLDPEQARQMAERLAATRQQLASVPAATVVANHAMGLYELAAIHLTREDPSLTDAVIAIDALGALVEGLEGRLGEPEATLRDALANIRMAFVQIKSALGG